MRCLIFISVLLLVGVCQAVERDYQLKPQQVAEDTYVLIGHDEHFSFSNGGNIVNTGFIVTEAGVVVIDSGPSRLYGEQLKAAIARVTDKPVVKLFITHMHPDHFLGNQAFEDLPIGALKKTQGGIRLLGETFNDNLYRLVGSWMKGTRVVAPNLQVEPGLEEIGGHRLQLIALKGHTGADLVILDQTSGVLFAGDLVFYGRTPTTPHARVDEWQAALQQLQKLDFKVLVPGHGPPVTSEVAISQTSAYLNWLQTYLTEQAGSGAAMAELLQPEAPQHLRELAVFSEEYTRSLSHLYPALEAAALAEGKVEQQQ
ncbi:MAG: quinoprotein relay system zinc metallohydrolase 1 [Candidatus Thiodiazotropha lotti]|nr:quinoprotein relay system zinc metallohydrolase 1 [Candidatus Thiodiazotropha lotti]